MARSFLAHCFALAALGVCIPALHAQDHLLDDLYGRGVHAYFSRNYQDAHKLLSEAATSGSKDPRVYYFRALADLRLNKSDDAAADLKQATELEFSGDAPFQVSKALERVQGTERLMIEDTRRKARLTIRNAAEERAKIRYGSRIKAEAAVLRNPPGGAAPAGAEAPAAAAPETLPGAPAGAKPAAVPAAETETPAGVKPATPTKPAVPPADDPFGDNPAKPVVPAVPSAEPVVPAKPGAPGAAPAVPGKPAAAEDPFGDTPAKPATPPPAAPPPAAKPAAVTDPAAPPSGKGTVLGSFGRAFSKAVPLPAIPGIPGAKPPVAEAPIPKGDPNAPDPFGDASAAKPAAPKAPAAPPAVPPPAKPAAAPAKPGAKAAEEDPFKKG